MKYRFQPSLIVGLVNGLLAAFFLAIFVYFFKEMLLANFAIAEVVSLCFIALPLVMHGGLFFHLLQSFFKQQPPRVKVRYYWLLTLVPSCLLGSFFVFYFFASDWLGLLLLAGVLGFVWWVGLHFSRMVALTLVLIAFVFLGTALIRGFEEDYCLDKAGQADPSGQAMVKPDESDKQILSEFNLESNQQVSLHFLTHFRCHSAFKPWQAIRESYLPRL